MSQDDDLDFKEVGLYREDRCKSELYGPSVAWLEIVNSFFSSLGVTKSHHARLPCGTYMQKIILLRIFHGRYSGWYENFGYKPDLYLTEEVIKQLHDLSASQLYLEEVQSIHLIFTIDPVVIAELWQKYPPENSKLGDYMISIFKRDFSDYSRLEAFIWFINGS